ncbi:Gaa1-domain-containing protein [Dentipellis sp. KUC8613]|nr:Gaa1-domain-containing protein [Dentipellis sp. KUC8613]
MLLDRLLNVVRRFTGRDKLAANRTKIRRRKAMTIFIWNNLHILRLVLLLAGYGWMLALPLPQLGNNVYIDENALQPGQVNTYWNWGDVYHADRYLEELEQLRDRNASSAERARFFATEFTKLGIPSSTQDYQFNTSMETLSGTNAYAIFSSPRASGAEAVIISASWFSGSDEGKSLNLRGVATVLALSGFLKQYSHWSKDIIFVISDGYLEGMHAWISSYHGVEQANLRADELTLASGVIWTALNIDYPGHSFSHLGVFREGLNGRLPNQDLINSFRLISQHTGGVPILLYDHREPTDFPGRQEILNWLPSWVPKGIAEQPDVMEYAYRAKNIVRHAKHQARGTASGVHGLLHQFRIDAITLYAVPSNGPHGFHALGRVVESTLRTMSNLLERLHASFFFYILVTPALFLKIGMYLPSAVLVGTALMFGGLGEWIKAGWVEVVDNDEKHGPEKKWVRRNRDVLPPLAIMAATHIVGTLLFWTISSSWFMANQKALTYPVVGLVALIPLLALLIPSSHPTENAPISILLKSLLLSFASPVISISSMLNFFFAALLAIALGGPLSITSSSPSLLVRVLRYAVYATLALGPLLMYDEVRQAVWQWEVLGVWFAPVVCIFYIPIMLQAGIVCLLPS